MRSIPEKTLEHWSSIYLSNRFPEGALWWPSSGEDVLAELPRLAATGPGKTLALELKTTEAVGTNHKLWIDAPQLDRYLRPPVGPPLPVYYVFPIPHWTGPLTSQHGSTPGAPGAMAAAPPEWWRQRVGWPWFGDWLYVMSARAVGSALPSDWTKGSRARLFTLNTAHTPGRLPPWKSLFARMPAVAPVRWKPFWTDVTRCGPPDGVRWLTIPGGRNQPDQVRVLAGDQESTWSLAELLDQRRPDVALAATGDSGNDHVMLLHLPHSALAAPGITAGASGR
jgi:hypothetical protein